MYVFHRISPKSDSLTLGMFPRINTENHGVGSFIVNGFSIKEMTVGISAPLNAAYPMLVTLLGMVTEVRPEHSMNILIIDIQLIMF